MDVLGPAKQTTFGCKRTQEQGNTLVREHWATETPDRADGWAGGCEGRRRRKRRLIHPIGRGDSSTGTARARHCRGRLVKRKRASGFPGIRLGTKDALSASHSLFLFSAGGFPAKLRACLESRYCTNSLTQGPCLALFCPVTNLLNLSCRQW